MCLDRIKGTCGYDGLVEEGIYSPDQIDELNANLQISDHDGTSLLLFNLEDDPYELTNAYVESEHYDMVADMANTIKAKGDI